MEYLRKCISKQWPGSIQRGWEDEQNEKSHPYVEVDGNLNMLKDLIL